MANNVAQLTTLIQNDLTRTDVSATQILYDLKASVRDYEAHRFHFNERSLSITISATNCYALSLWGAQLITGGDIIEVDSLAATVNGNTYLLDPIGFTEFRGLTINTTLTGEPQKYAVFGDNVYLYPKPNGTYTAILSGHVKWPELTSQSSSNVWTDAGRELIRCATLKRLWGRLIKDPEQAQVMQIAENQALEALQRRSDALSSNRIVSWF